MRISIFNLNNKTSYKDEYIKIKKVLNSKCLSFKNKKYTYFEFVNEYLFNNWKYRNTYLDLYEYLEFIGIKITSNKISLDSFINFIEFILNIQLLQESIKYYNDNVVFSTKASSVLFHNIPIILDKLGYQAYDIDDRVIIYKKDIVYTDLLDDLTDDIKELLLSYNNINNNGIKTKRIIINKLYNFITEKQEKYKSMNSSIYNTIKLVVNKMGIIGEIDNKYKNLSNYKIRKYYDYCFRLICYLINSENITKIKDEIKNSA